MKENLSESLFRVCFGKNIKSLLGLVMAMTKSKTHFIFIFTKSLSSMRCLSRFRFYLRLLVLEKYIIYIRIIKRVNWDVEV